MRDQTSLPHEYIGVGRLWNPATKTGNFDTSRAPIDLIVLHSMDGFLNGTTAWFQNLKVNQSAHYGIGLDGRIVQWIPESATAYDAGNYAVNQRSISVEHEDRGNNATVRPDAMYEASARLVAEIALAYNIPLDRQHVKKHNEIVSTGCPGTLDVDRILARAQALIHPVDTNAGVEEPLHNYQIKPTEFVNMVTEGTEYRRLYAFLGLDVSMAKRVDSHTLVVEEINRRVNVAKTSVSQNEAVIPELSVPNTPQTGFVPAQEPTSMWQKDVFEILKDILGSVRGGRTH